MVVRLHRGQLDYFRRKARNDTKEIYAVLLGRQVTINLIEIESLRYPLLAVSTSEEVKPDQESINQIYQQATKDGLYWVGSIHSHPNYPPVMSRTDHKGHRTDGDKVSGIVEVTNRKTRVVFWQEHSSLPCKIEYF